jgi:hypothetical protein
MRKVLSLGICLGLMVLMPAILEAGGGAEVVGAGDGSEGYCYAAARCENDRRIDCEGTNVCVSQDHTCPIANGWVRCDGVTTYCPDPCFHPTDCDTQGDYCTTDLDCNPVDMLMCAICECEYGSCECSPIAP